jgi:cytochrome c biogenesis protein CcmG/thiol:disulfide interchange protein DsbE
VSRLLRPVPLVALAAVLALLALLAYGIAENQPGQSIDSQLAAGKRPSSPPVELPQLHGGGAGGKVKLSSYRGKVVVLNYWASWCPPCLGEAPVLARWQPKLAASNGTIVGVDVLDVSSDAQRFVTDHKLDYPQLRDGDGSTLKSFEIVGYPETIVLDRRGRIAATSRGAIDERFFVRQVRPLLKESS